MECETFHVDCGEGWRRLLVFFFFLGLVYKYLLGSIAICNILGYKVVYQLRLTPTRTFHPSHDTSVFYCVYSVEYMYSIADMLEYAK
jgi:hypothetical protein